MGYRISFPQIALKITLGLVLVGISSCSTNFRGKVTISGSNTITLPPSDGSSGAFKVSQVILDTTAVTPQTLALIGDGSNSMGTVCRIPSGGGPSPCACTFVYSPFNASTQQVEIPVTYVEQNMIRCSYSALPSTLTSFMVSIHLTTADQYSNQLTFNLASLGITFDSTDSKNFVSPIRFQCRDIVRIPYMLDGTVYDPFQSEDPHLTYPLDFYTSNLGLSLQAYVDGFSNVDGMENWNCPGILDPGTYLEGSMYSPGTASTGTALYQYVKTNGLNLTVYSQAPSGASNSSVIYPPSPGSGDDRSTFYLAKKRGGVFTVPVNGLMAPGINTGSTGLTQFAKDPLGWAAPPVPVGFGAGKETCPDKSVPIPSGFQWKKLWLFRATLPQRSMQESAAIKSGVKAIACNPGDWYVDSASTVLAPVFPGCYNTFQNPLLTAKDKDNRYFSITLSDASSGTQFLEGSRVYLADRYLYGSSQCVRLQNPVMANTCVNNSGTFPGPGCNGFDYWEAELPYSSKVESRNYPRADPPIGCGPSSDKIAADPLNVCRQAFNNTTDNATLNLANTGQGVNPVANNNGDLISTSLDRNGARFDYLFVVSPPEVTTTDMQNGNSIARPYMPMRYKLAEDCTDLSNPNNPLCDSGSNLLKYSMKQHDIGTQGDPPADNASSPIVFPACVLQPTNN